MNTPKPTLHKDLAIMLLLMLIVGLLIGLGWLWAAVYVSMSLIVGLCIILSPKPKQEPPKVYQVVMGHRRSTKTFADLLKDKPNDI